MNDVIIFGRFHFRSPMYCKYIVYSDYMGGLKGKLWIPAKNDDVIYEQPRMASFFLREITPWEKHVRIIFYPFGLATNNHSYTAWTLFIHLPYTFLYLHVSLIKRTVVNKSLHWLPYIKCTEASISSLNKTGHWLRGGVKGAQGGCQWSATLLCWC